VGDSGLKFARDFGRVWFPLGTDEQLFRIPWFIVLVSKKPFCVKIADEAFASIATIPIILASLVRSAGGHLFAFSEAGTWSLPVVRWTFKSILGWPSCSFCLFKGRVWETHAAL
jgi:hypothetical protein